MRKAAWASGLMCLVCLSASAAPPATIYRCGPDGRVFSQVPCAGGEALEAGDPRSAAQRAEARRVAARERDAAAAMERRRRADEAAAQPAAGLTAAAAAPASAAARGRAKAGDKTKDFVATVPGSGKRVAASAVSR